MALTKAPVTTNSALFRIVGVAGVLALIGLIGYVGWTVAIFIPPQGSQTVPNIAAAPVDLSNPKEAKQAALAAKAGAVVIPSKAWGEVREELALLHKYSALIEYMKIFIPVFSFLLLSGLTATGFWFVNARVAEASYDMYKEANDKVADAAKELDAAKESYAGLESKLRNFLEHKLDVASFGVEHALSLLNWNLNKVDDAIHHEESALAKITESLERSQDVDPDSYTALKDWAVNVESTLGYYYTEKWLTSKVPTDAKRAMHLARRLPATLGAAASGDVASLVDNYLYAMARSGEPLLGSDRQQIVNWFAEYGAQVKEIRLGANSTPDDKLAYSQFEALEKECRNLLNKKPTSI